MQQKEPPHQPVQGASPSTSKIPKTPEEWKAHWAALGQEWRTEPEINAYRKAELTQRRTLNPDEKKGLYPFGGVKLDRADIEWLLATHENGRGPVLWSDETQHKRKGLDLRRASLRGDKTQRINLSGLPLSQLIGGRYLSSRNNFSSDQVVIHLERADLSETHLEKAMLYMADLKEANLADAHLERANLSRADLKKANLADAHLEGAMLRMAHLEGANLTDAHLEGADLIMADLEGADLTMARLEGANLTMARLEGANLAGADLKEANLTDAHLEGAMLRMADLEGADLTEAYLEGANLVGAHLKGTVLRDTYLVDENHTGPSLVDCQWGNCTLAVVEWSQIHILGEEYRARQEIDMEESEDERDKKGKKTRLGEYKDAVRANRQLFVALQSQGLNEDASRFAYRASVLQKNVLWYRLIQDDTPLRIRLSLLGNWLFSWFMFLIAGYGYRFGRSLLTYLAVITGFATLYYSYGISDVDAHGKPGPHHLSFYEALVVSMTAFHGRGFFVGTFSPGDPQALVAAIEAFLGLLIEVIFIATLTRRLFTQ